MNTVKSTFIQIIKRKELLLFIVLIIAGISLCGWLYGKVTLASSSSAYIHMAPLTAIIFIILSSCFFLKNKYRESPIVQLFNTALVALVILFCLIIFLGYLLNFTWDSENIFIKNQNTFGNVPYGRMSPITALFFIFICISVLSITQHNFRIIKYMGGNLSLLVCLLSSVLSIGYLYKSPLLYKSIIIPISLPTVICFMLFSITLLRLYDLKFWTYNQIKDNNVTLQLLRTFSPIIVFVVILQGYLDATFSFNDVNPALSSVLVLLIVLTITAVVVLRVSNIIGDKLLSAEQLLKESEKKLHQLNADKDHFISILGHDLKNPFNNILGLSEVLTDEINSLNSDEIKEIADNINKSAQITNKLLEDILIWARIQQGKIPFEPQNLNLKDICTDTIEILTLNANAKNIAINYSSADHINVFADNDMLNTVLRNLVSNAIKFTDNGGAININAVENSGNVTISVSDNGIGISPDNLLKLFDFSEVLTTKGTACETGTGLGLLLCKEFIEKHGGKIWVESEVGKGSNFKFTMPVSSENF